MVQQQHVRASRGLLSELVKLGDKSERARRPPLPGVQSQTETDSAQSRGRGPYPFSFLQRSEKSALILRAAERTQEEGLLRDRASHSKKTGQVCHFSEHRPSSRLSACVLLVASSLWFTVTNQRQSFLLVCMDANGQKRYPIDNKEGSGSALLSTGLVSKKIKWILLTFYKCVHGHRAVYFSLYSLMLYNIHYKKTQQLIIFNGLKLHSTGGKRCLEDLNKC